MCKSNNGILQEGDDIHMKYSQEFSSDLHLRKNHGDDEVRGGKLSKQRMGKGRHAFVKGKPTGVND